MSTRCPALPVPAFAADTASAITLAAGTATSARGRRGLRLHCLAGTVWATRSGDACDHVLRAGEQLDAAPGIRIAVQALSPARIRFACV